MSKRHYGIPLFTYLLLSGLQLSCATTTPPAVSKQKTVSEKGGEPSFMVSSRNAKTSGLSQSLPAQAPLPSTAKLSDTKIQNKASVKPIVPEALHSKVETVASPAHSQKSLKNDNEESKVLKQGVTDEAASGICKTAQEPPLYRFSRTHLNELLGTWGKSIAFHLWTLACATP